MSPPPTPTGSDRSIAELTEPGQEIAYIIVNAFLDSMTFQSTEAESLIKQVIFETGAVIQEENILNIDEVFRPMFFYYPNGLADRTRAEPRDPSEYISQWRDIAAWRQMASAGAPPHATELLTKAQVQHILHQYIENFIHHVANERQRLRYSEDPLPRLPLPS